MAGIVILLFSHARPLLFALLAPAHCVSRLEPAAIGLHQLVPVHEASSARWACRRARVAVAAVVAKANAAACCDEDGESAVVARMKAAVAATITLSAFRRAGN